MEKYLDGEKVFLANYSDNLTDFNLPDLIEPFYGLRKTAAFLCVRPSLSCHCVSIGDGGLVQEIKTLSQSEIMINGGYFIFDRTIFDYIKAGEELVREPFQRLIEKKQLVAHPYDGFWRSMDTFKEKQELDDLYSKGLAPWQLWKRQSNGDGAVPVTSESANSRLETRRK